MLATRRSIAAQARLEGIVERWFEDWISLMEPTVTIAGDGGRSVTVLGDDLARGPLQQAAIDLIRLIDEETD